MAKMARVSTKKILIDKANSTIVIAVGIAAFISAFSLVTSRSLLAKRSYQARVIHAQEQARDQLVKNIEAVDNLKSSYQSFAGRQANIIGGSSSGTGERDGDNAKIVLDALPSKYDFPALVASLEKIMDERNFVILSIAGFDEEATRNQSGGGGAVQPLIPGASASTTTAPTTTQTQTGGDATPMPFELSAKGSYAPLTDLLKIYQYSIRPIHSDKVLFTANDDGTVTLKVIGKSYFQAEKTLSITEEVVQ